MRESLVEKGATELLTKTKLQYKDNEEINESCELALELLMGGGGGGASDGRRPRSARR